MSSAIFASGFKQSPDLRIRKKTWKLKPKGAYSFTCDYCKKTFPDCNRRHTVCAADDCREKHRKNRNQQRAETQRAADAITAPDKKPGGFDEAKAERVWREKYADAEKRYHYDGLTPEQIKSRAAKSAARLAELRAELRRLGGKV